MREDLTAIASHVIDEILGLEQTEILEPLDILLAIHRYGGETPVEVLTIAIELIQEELKFYYSEIYLPKN